MRKAINSLVIAAMFASSLAVAHASTSAGEPVASQKIDATTEAPQSVKSVPAAAAETTQEDHAFRVNDEKGLLLTCSAPNIAADANTNLFKDCALAPNRTLNDLMDTFVGAIHYEQKQREEERAEWMRQLEEKDK